MCHKCYSKIGRNSIWQSNYAVISRIGEKAMLVERNCCQSGRL